MRLLRFLIIWLIVASAFAAEPEVYYVHRVIDGDTIEVIYPTKKLERVRLIGINTPESYKGPQADKEAKRKHKDLATILKMGNEAKKFTQTILATQQYIILEFDVQERDRFGRVLAYVYLMNEQMLNEFLVQEGMAEVMTVPPNVRHAKIFKEAEKSARQGKRGFWNE